MNDPVFTVILPTTGEKGNILPFTINSVLQQSIKSLELIVIGDGPGESTQELMKRICKEDSRVSFLPYVKQRGRGLRLRHEVLMSQARGQNVCYICDRDLWAPDHLEKMAEALVDHDIAYTLSLIIRKEDVEFGPPLLMLGAGGHRQFFLDRMRHQHEFLPLSSVGHTMDMYKRLPDGWCKRKKGVATDYSMWLQFLDQPECRVTCTLTPTLLWFPTSSWTREVTTEKIEALREWLNRIGSPSWLNERWEFSFKKLYNRAASFRVRAALAEIELDWPEQ